ncbi:MAG TPA: hypothetical protein VN673_16315 [Clostridia bacterium]|nr:hypothetical protein [Clostridia bacterium]
MFGLFKKKPQPEQPKPDASLIVPRIKHTNFLAALRDIGTGPDDTPLTEPLVGDLIVTYAFDLSEAFQMVCPQDCQRLGIQPGQIRAIAVANLKRQLGNIGRQGEPPLLKMVVGGNLEACLLLVDDIWQSLAGKIPPEIVVGVPTRDVLLITTTSSTKGGLQMLRDAVKEAHGQETTHALTQQLLVRRGDRWEVFDGAV